MKLGGLGRAEDSLEAELMREVENGRLVRLLTKFGFINERPESVPLTRSLPSSLDETSDPAESRFDHDPRWAETGDRYIIKLFRDYVFHQVDENGRPVTDLSHVVTSLNKVCLLPTGGRSGPLKHVLTPTARCGRG